MLLWILPEYLRDGGAKLMTLFRPATGEVRAKGVISVTKAVLHPWLQEQLLSMLAWEELDGHCKRGSHS